MSARFLRVSVGLSPLPDDGRDVMALIAWARKHHILGQVAATWEGKSHGKLREVFENARIWTGHDRRMLRFEMNRIGRALAGSGIQPIVLKGGAYVAQDLIAGVGRRVSDIDILVDDHDLGTVERLLREAGWVDEPTTAGAYDQAYYREWMHELPPLRHGRRRTLVDVHHRLLPRTARLQPDHRAMMAAAQPIEGTAMRSFAPLDRFIHSSIHIFADGAFETPARSLIELYHLFNDLTEEDQNWLFVRAADVKAKDPVAVALWAIYRFFGSGSAARLLRGQGLGATGWPLKRAITSVVEQDFLMQVAKLYLYIRSHFLRMPPCMLARHLGRKAFRRVSKGTEGRPAPQ